ncbi:MULTISPECIES: alpha/beta hydrolase [unclassified Streptomyces]|uniref:alpha/beta hydrolase n=1 Tax=unclassified Streptomyces TaxID=2593676 RepID=UPI002DD85621|nr:MULTISPECIES: alpha/beta hydrolase [unclassified Streptomyces]WSA94971.1 alpha/beta hydrolase family protein [Streptomyces sp. NBC_01795]WSB79391.1 alpha/beta hydrolase family protein [Streptomyces sp. NBC_01775]WSS12403.1 alpha/beta hydrolase family protein [Streptomyces sp. NBC_01186]WSS41116.1 alpha/beta hydrolase family protein [Streptomyces sp. NBC_01187]
MKRRLKRALIAASLAGAAIAGTTGLALGTEQTPVTGPAPGAAAWRADNSLGRTLPDPATAGPERVASFFAGLDPAQVRALTRRHPLTVGNLDGAPVRVRYQANKLALKNARQAELSRGADPELTTQDHRLARSKADRYSRLLAPHHRILAFDPRGRGQVAEVYGDLPHADRTAVIVPGSDIDLGTFDDGGKNRYGRPAGMAKSLRAEMTRRSPGSRTAVIAWVGYTTPVGLGPDAATGRLAEAGAPRLERFLHGLARTGAPAPALLCHSYGSVVCGEAASSLEREDARDMVVFGSPGIRAESVSALRTRVPVWAAHTEKDWIGNIPNVSLLGLGHGADPAGEGFGARVVSSDEADGHAGYLEPGTDSLANFSAVALRSYHSVHCSATSKECSDARTDAR